MCHFLSLEILKCVTWTSFHKLKSLDSFIREMTLTQGTCVFNEVLSCLFTCRWKVASLNCTNVHVNQCNTSKTPALINLNSLSYVILLVSGDLGLMSAKRLHWGAECLCQADGVEPAKALATFCASAFWQQVFLEIRWSLFMQIYKCFQTDSVRMVSTCLLKGKLSSLAVHNGISLRKSDEEECVCGTLMKAYNWQNEALFSCGQETHARINTHTQPSFSAYVSHTHTHITALILLMNRLVLSLPVHLCVCGTCVAYWKQSASVQT